MGPIIKNEPAVSTLLSQAEILVTTPAIVSEIRDSTTRDRVQTTLLPFLTLREPRPASIKLITDFAHRTGDLSVLSRPDIQILALAYELECERNGGDWRLRSAPGQKRTNGPSPSKRSEAEAIPTEEISQDSVPGAGDQIFDPAQEAISERTVTPEDVSHDLNTSEPTDNISKALADTHMSDLPEAQESSEPSELNNPKEPEEPVSADDQSAEDRAADATAPPVQSPDSENQSPPSKTDSDSDSDSEGWITPSNIKKHQDRDSLSTISSTLEPKTMQVATITTDFAMQNVLLQMNLNLLSPKLQRVKHLKTFVLRCHACFNVHKDMSKQFCARCGKPTLTRVACSTNQNGEFVMHLKRSMQWNTRGDRYSIPKPVAGSANGRISGGGKGGWGQGLILAEDQKEYVKAVDQEKRVRQRDLMDEDYLPSIFTGRGRGLEEGPRST
ncbi:20S-pre-rRNA D-site endonuclease nob1 [Coniosporium tulheliwenetii]|uniref:20S-pre-rRNA D-site endonuclease nob1 n=1 Tax=Coniosporium tulheliwenetii TaxID=3383036 RepID=A0ACC2YXQ0_9PEZI|nr:20S-pre-rRNA D-site endonuclease nob1 [Cladosporium sp. JES 115]